MDFGYIRLSVLYSDPKDQLKDITIADECLFVEQYCKRGERFKERQKLLSLLEDGDILHVERLDRLAVNPDDLEKTIEILLEKNVTLYSHHESLILSQKNAPSTRIFCTMIRFMKKWQRSIFSELQEEGINVARESGIIFGRPSRVTEEQKEEVRRIFLRNIHTSIVKICAETGVPRTTCYKIRDLVLKGSDNTENPNHR